MVQDNLQKSDASGSPFRGRGGQAIILAGGLGTRLQEAVPDLPKCLAPVNGRPFLFYVINYLRSQGIEKFIFSLGHKHEVIEEYLNLQFSTLNFQCSVEKEPLGTGGAILAACYKATEENVLVINGDTLFKISIAAASSFHFKKQAHCSLVLKPMKNFDRYGVVELNEDNSIKKFQEKKFYKEGLINGGVYILNVPAFMDKELPSRFSFEKDFLEKFYVTRRIFATIQDAYFIDIGIPEDYWRAQEELKQPALDLKNIDKSWTLFLDRDGVVNYEKQDDYIRNRDEFRFYEGVKEAMKILAEKFGKIFIVSNQRGVGKQLMTENDLADIHKYLKAEIESAGGRIDGIYYCTAVDAKDPDRKPNPGMIYQAKLDFPEIDLSRSFMIGNKPSDMLLGKNAGVYTVYLDTTHPETPFPHPDIDTRFNSLAAFAKAL
jgi:D-glycero-alpha-D-manno-heptose 1-phosphate guanylyltransferase